MLAPIYQRYNVVYSFQVPVYSTVYKPRYVPTTVYEKVYKTQHETHLVPEYIPQYITETKYRDNYITDTVYKTHYNTLYKSIYITETAYKNHYVTQTDYVTETETRYQPQYLTETQIEPVETTKVVYKTEVIYETKYLNPYASKPHSKPSLKPLSNYGNYQGPVYIPQKTEMKPHKDLVGLDEKGTLQEDFSYGDPSLLSEVDLKSIGLEFRDGKIQAIKGADTDEFDKAQISGTGELSQIESDFGLSSGRGKKTSSVSPGLTNFQSSGQLPLEDSKSDFRLLSALTKSSHGLKRPARHRGIFYDEELGGFTVDLNFLNDEVKFDSTFADEQGIDEMEIAFGRSKLREGHQSFDSSKGLIAEAPLAMALDGHTLGRTFENLNSHPYFATEFKFDTPVHSHLQDSEGFGKFAFGARSRDSFSAEDAKVQPKYIFEDSSDIG